MTQPIGPSSGPRWGLLDPTSPLLVSQTTPRNPDPPEPVHDFAAQTERPSSGDEENPAPPACGAEGARGPAHHAPEPPSAAQIRERLDAFRDRAVGTYRTPVGVALVHAPFRMDGGELSAEDARATRDAARGLGMSEADATRILFGRGRPEEIHGIAQALIDEGALPAAHAGESLADRVRRMMTEHGLGFDCAGYTGQALLASRGWSRPNSPLASVPLVNDDLSNLEGRGFVPTSLEDVRAGDIIALGPDSPGSSGHRVIVYAARDADDQDRGFLVDLARKSLTDADTRRDPREAGRARVRLEQIETFVRQPLEALVVDSSWGSHGYSQVGGLERHLWLHSRATDEWAWTDAFARVSVTRDPYEHPMRGAYRPHGEP
jgi:hypothetical protein